MQRIFRRGDQPQIVETMLRCMREPAGVFQEDAVAGPRPEIANCDFDPPPRGGLI